jgi:hypothetical protein
MGQVERDATGCESVKLMARRLGIIATYTCTHEDFGFPATY